MLENKPGPGINVTERSRKLFRDVRLRGGLKVRCSVLHQATSLFSKDSQKEGQEF